jgi:hypothetical protein
MSDGISYTHRAKAQCENQNQRNKKNLRKSLNKTGKCAIN